MTYEDLKSDVSDWVINSWRFRKSSVKSFRHSKLQEQEPMLNGAQFEDMPASFDRVKNFIGLISTPGYINKNKMFHGFKGTTVICVTHAFFLKRIGLLNNSPDALNKEIRYCAINSMRVFEMDFERKSDKNREEMLKENKGGKVGYIKYKDLKRKIRIELGFDYFSGHLDGIRHSMKPLRPKF